MLIIGLILAVLVYGILAFLWFTAAPQLNGPVGALGVLNKILLVPDNTIFTILRGLILATLFYLVADFLISGARRASRRRNAATPVSEVKKKWVKERAGNDRIAPE